MPFLLIAMAMGLMAHDDLAARRAPSAWPWPLGLAVERPGWVLPALLLAKAAVVGLFALAAAWTRRTLLRRPWAGRGAANATHRLIAVAFLSLVALYLADLALGALLVIRSTLGDTIALDEALLASPTLVGFIALWWTAYPIDRRLREAVLMRKLDTGEPVPPLWTRWQYVLSQARHQLALTAIPLAAIVTWHEAVRRLTPEAWAKSPSTIHALTLAGAGAVYVLAPMVIRHVWDTQPLPAGDLRNRLIAMCRSHRVRVREMLLWRTHGAIINAAVLGLLPLARYILLTDALLERLPARNVEAVMAHEVGHLARRHLPWFIVVTLALLGSLEAVWQLATQAAWALGVGAWSEQEPWRFVALLAALGLGPLILFLASFFWITRRFERQADSFALQHLSRSEWNAQAEPRDATPVITPGAIDALTGALQHVADLDGRPVDRPSLWHGSIRGRQDYLRGLRGLPVDRLPIDAQVRWIKAASLLLACATLAREWASYA